ncbi:MAG: Fic family protein [Lachnospiraceae bacterium]|nr:Fic family protein [Lachnospiraceae bacterium]
MADKIYCYPNSDVLINKLNIRDMDKLRNFERRLTMLRLSELLDKPIVGKFDLEHLQQIHKYIFQDIYEWAGQIRTVDIAKGNMFCNVKFIEPQAKLIFDNLKKDNYLIGFEEDVFVKRLAYYFAEINALHPFREGNGRSQREFIRSLALRNGYIINFSNISREDMIKASSKSFLCDYTEMEQIFSICIRKRSFGPE